jgi:nucleoside-diphosphate kinase
MKSLSQFIKESSLELNDFAILKPEVIEYKEAWIDLLKNKGWQLIRQNQTKLSLDQAKELYKMHKDEDFYNDLCEYMSSGECICCSCYKDCEEPFKEMKTIKNSVRDKWGKSEMKNAMHSSDSLENVNRESKICLN